MADELADAVLKLFIGNLPFDSVHGDVETVLKSADIDEEDIRKFDIHMVRDRETDKFKGFAYVEVSTQEHIDKMLALNGVQFGDRQLRIDNATGRGGSRGRGRGRGRGGFEDRRGGRGGGFGGGGRDLQSNHGGPSRGPNDFEMVRGRHHGGQGGGGRGHFQNRDGGAFQNRDGGAFQHREPVRQEDIVAVDDSERPRLQLKPKTVDPKEMEEKKKKEAEAEEERKKKIFGH